MLQGLGLAEEADGLAREAVQLARQVGEPSTLCYVLESVLHMSSGPAHIGERLSYAIECLEAARAAGDLEKRMFGPPDGSMPSSRRAKSPASIERWKSSNPLFGRFASLNTRTCKRASSRCAPCSKGGLPKRNN